MYSVGPSHNYAKQLPVVFWADVTSIFRMRLTSYKLQDGRDINKINRWKYLRKIHNVYFTIPNHHWKFQFSKLKSYRDSFSTRVYPIKYKSNWLIVTMCR